MKITKTVKFYVILLAIVPVVLFLTAVTQTFILKSKKNTLNNANSQLEQNNAEYEKQQEIYNYLNSDEYLEDYYKHYGYGTDEGGNTQYYGNNEDDINIIVTQP